MNRLSPKLDWCRFQLCLHTQSNHQQAVHLHQSSLNDELVHLWLLQWTNWCLTCNWTGIYIIIPWHLTEASFLDEQLYMERRPLLTHSHTFCSDPVQLRSIMWNGQIDSVYEPFPATAPAAEYKRVSNNTGTYKTSSGLYNFYTANMSCLI